MKQIKKNIITLSLLSTLLISYIFLNAQKISTVQLADSKNINATQDQEKTFFTERQESTYIKSMLNITNRSQSFINLLNKKISDKKEKIETIYIVFADSDKTTIDNINQELRNIFVPSKYKEFHLLISRSLLNLSSYVNTANPHDMLTGLELFDQVKEEYNKMLSA